MDDLSAEDQIERLKEAARVCTYPTDAATIKKRYKDTSLLLFKVCYPFLPLVKFSHFTPCLPYYFVLVILDFCEIKFYIFIVTRGTKTNFSALCGSFRIMQCTLRLYTYSHLRKWSQF